MDILLGIKEGGLAVACTGLFLKYTDEEIIGSVVVVGIDTTRTGKTMHRYSIQSIISNNFR